MEALEVYGEIWSGFIWYFYLFYVFYLNCILTSLGFFILVYIKHGFLQFQVDFLVLPWVKFVPENVPFRYHLQLFLHMRRWIKFLYFFIGRVFDTTSIKFLHVKFWKTFSIEILIIRHFNTFGWWLKIHALEDSFQWFVVISQHEDSS